MNEPVPTFFSTIPDGDQGTDVTLTHMAELVRSGSTKWPVRNAASQVVAALDFEKPNAVPRAIRRWVASHFRFVPDPINQEALHDPALMISVIERDGRMGADCDDAAILAGALGASVGCAVRFVVAAFLDKDAPYTHVWAELYPPMGVGDEWIECDVTRHAQAIPVDAISRARIYPVLS